MKWKNINQLVQHRREVLLINEDEILYDIDVTSYPLQPSREFKEKWMVSHEFYKQKWDSVKSNKKMLILKGATGPTGDLEYSYLSTALPFW